MAPRDEEADGNGMFLPRRIVRPEASCPRGLWRSAGDSGTKTADVAVIDGKRVSFFIGALDRDNIGASLLSNQIHALTRARPFLLDERTPGVATHREAACFYCHEFLSPEADYLVYLSSELYLEELPRLVWSDVGFYEMPSVVDRVYHGFFVASRNAYPLFDWCRDLKPDEAFLSFVALARKFCSVKRLPDGIFFPMRSTPRKNSKAISLFGVEVDDRNRLLRQMHQSPRPWREVCRHFGWADELRKSEPYPHGTKIDINCDHAGIGDLIDVAHITNAIEAENPGVSVNVYSKKAKSGFVKLFGRYGPVRDHSLVHVLPPTPWHRLDKDPGGRGTRIENWALYCGASAPVLAPPVISAESDRWADEFLEGLLKPAVVLSPISTCKMRSWPFDSYEALGELLEAQGFGVVMMDDPDGIDTRNTRFKRLFGVGAEREAAVIRKGGLLIGNDSGMAHLSAAMEVPTLVICGPTDGQRIFSWYGSARWIAGPLPCTGCYFYKENGWTVECEHGCLSMQSISAKEILHLSLEMLAKAVRT